MSIDDHASASQIAQPVLRLRLKTCDLRARGGGEVRLSPYVRIALRAIDWSSALSLESSRELGMEDDSMNEAESLRQRGALTGVGRRKRVSRNH